MTPKRNRADGPKNAGPARRRASADPNVLRAALLPRQSTGQGMPRQPWAAPRPRRIAVQQPFTIRLQELLRPPPHLLLRRRQLGPSLGDVRVQLGVEGAPQID